MKLLSIITLLLSLVYRSDAADLNIFQSIKNAVGANAVKYPDDEWKNFIPEYKAHFLKMRKILGDSGKCLVAITSDSKFAYASKGEFSNLKASPLLSSRLPSSVACVQDIVLDPGTQKEVGGGCSLLSYDLNSQEYSVYPGAVSVLQSPKRCASGGFEDLMKMKGWWSRNTYRDITIEQTIFSMAWVRRKQLDKYYVLIFASSPKYQDWFVQARERGRKFVSDRLSKTSHKESQSTEKEEE
jgi:hypothetical protein